MLAAVWTGPNLVARPFPGFRLHRKCYQTVYIFGLLFTALVTRCLRFWRFRKRREPLFHPCPDLAIVSLSLSLVRIFSLFHFYFLSRPRYHATSNFLRWWRVKEGKGLSPFRHGIGIVARMHSHNDDGGNVETRTRDFYAPALVRVDAHRARFPLGGSRLCRRKLRGNYERLHGYETAICFFFFGISSLVLPMNLEWEFFLSHSFSCCYFVASRFLESLFFLSFLFFFLTRNGVKVVRLENFFKLN